MDPTYRKMLKLDLFFPPVYGPCLFLALFWAAELLKLSLQPWQIAIIPAVIMLCDWIENSILVKQTDPDLAEISESSINIAGRATQVKVILYTFCGIIPPLAVVARWLCG